MDNNELRLLQGHMGHSEKIHLRNYAQQTDLLERGKVARILTSIARGTIKLPKDSRNIDEMPTPDDDCCVEGMN